MRMLTPAEEADDAPEVEWEDQQRINTFSKLNNRSKDLNDTLEEKKSEKSALDDLEQELELSVEEEPIRYRVGESFVVVPFNRAKGLLAKDQKAKGKEIDDIQTRLDENAEEMKQLKVLLYGKFGSQINLD